MPRFSSSFAFAALLLAACDGGGEGAGGLSEGEAQQLDKAVERIEARAPSPAAAESRAYEAEVRARLDAEQVSAARR